MSIKIYKHLTTTNNRIIEILKESRKKFVPKKKRK